MCTSLGYVSSCSAAASSQCTYLIAIFGLFVASAGADGHSRRWIYTSTLAYIVDANIGRSSSAVATNSAVRGVSAFVALEVAVPLQVGLAIFFAPSH